MSRDDYHVNILTFDCRQDVADYIASDFSGGISFHPQRKNRANTLCQALLSPVQGIPQECRFQCGLALRKVIDSVDHGKHGNHMQQVEFRTKPLSEGRCHP